MVPKLILVEGLPGCGKSTTAQFLASQLRRAGRRARWHYEEEVPHPVFTERYAGSTWDGWVAGRLHRWTAFATEVESSDEVRILESSLFQTPLFTMLRENVARDVILAFLKEVQALLSPLGPLLIYLQHPRPDDALQMIMAQRGPAWEAHHISVLAPTPFATARGVAGTPGLLAYWREHGALTEHAVSESPLPMLVIDVTDGNWNQRRHAILDRLGVPLVKDSPVPEAYLRRFVGNYRGGSTPVRQCSVALRESRLVLDGLLWPENPLLPTAPDVFDVESWPFELHFEADRHDAMRTMRVVGPALTWGRVDGIFERA